MPPGGSSVAKQELKKEEEEEKRPSSKAKSETGGPSVGQKRRLTSQSDENPQPNKVRICSIQKQEDSESDESEEDILTNAQQSN